MQADLPLNLWIRFVQAEPAQVALRFVGKIIDDLAVIGICDQYAVVGQRLAHRELGFGQGCQRIDTVLTEMIAGDVGHQRGTRAS